VTAVELADRKQVQRGGEQTHPGGACHRMHHQVVGRKAGPEKFFEEPDEQGIAEDDHAAFGRFRQSLRVG